MGNSLLREISIPVRVVEKVAEGLARAQAVAGRQEVGPATEVATEQERAAEQAVVQAEAREEDLAGDREVPATVQGPTCVRLAGRIRVLAPAARVDRRFATGAVLRLASAGGM